GDPEEPPFADLERRPGSAEQVGEIHEPEHDQLTVGVDGPLEASGDEDVPEVGEDRVLAAVGVEPHPPARAVLLVPRRVRRPVQAGVRGESDSHQACSGTSTCRRTVSSSAGSANVNGVNVSTWVSGLPPDTAA